MKITLSKKEDFITINEVRYFNFGVKFDTMVCYDNYGVEKTIMFNGCLSIDEIIIQLNELIDKENKLKRDKE